MDLTPAFISAIGAALATPLLLALARRIRALRHLPDPRKSYAELAREYARWELYSVPLSLLLVASLGGVFWLALRAIYARYLETLEPGLFVIALPPVAWLAPALFFAIFAAALPLHAIYRLLLGRRRYAEYTEYGNQKFGLDSARLFRYLGNSLLPVCLALTLLAFDCYVRVTEQALLVNAYLGLGESRHRLDAVARIERFESPVAPGGARGRESHYVLRFADGAVLDFRRFPAEASLAQQGYIARLAADASGIDVRQRVVAAARD